MRRIVTGHDENEVAKVVIDDVPTNTRRSASGTSSTLIWCTDRTPADISIGENIEDMGARKIGTPPPANGTRFAVLEFAPGSVSPLHRTETIDYVVVISGELEMDLDDSTIRLRAGDVLVQRGTNHSWRNPTDSRLARPSSSSMRRRSGSGVPSPETASHRHKPPPAADLVQPPRAAARRASRRPPSCSSRRPSGPRSRN